MSERHDRGQGTGHGGGRGSGGTDRELAIGKILQFGAILGLVIVVVLAGMWGMAVLFKAQQQAADPRPSPIPEANARRLPPEPRLQASPPRDMKEFRARESDLVASYGWADQRLGIARIPIDRAMEIVLEKGLPVPPPLPKTAPKPVEASPKAESSPGGMRP